MHWRGENSTLKRPWGGLGAALGRPWAPPGPTLGPSVEKVFSKIGFGTSTWPKVPYYQRFCMVIFWQPRPTGVDMPKLVDVIIVNGGHLLRVSFLRRQKCHIPKGNAWFLFGSRRRKVVRRMASNGWRVPLNHSISFNQGSRQLPWAF